MRVVTAINGAAWNVATLAGLRHRDRPELERSNYRGREVSLAGGVAAAVGALAGSAGARRRTAVAAALAIAPAGALGALDDLTESSQGRAKGLRGHLTALREGRLTTGAIKLAGISLAGLAAGTVLAGGRTAPGGIRIADAVTSGALVAGTANLVNLLDLRPGRALKVVAAVAVPLALARHDGAEVAAGVLGSSAAAAPSDLAETTMLGDTGANALGAGLGVALAAHPHPAVRLGALAVVLTATLVSERISFSAVIDRTPWLRNLDDLGRTG